MNKVMYQVEVWDDENYSYDEAKNNGALSTTFVKEAEYSPESIQAALGLAGERGFNYKDKFKFKATRLIPYLVEGEVLEWNNYQVEVLAENPETALALAERNGLHCFSKIDSEIGVEAAPKLHINTHRNDKLSN